MLRLTAQAQRQLHALEAHYLALDRPAAVVRLTESIAMAVIRIEEDEGPIYSAPRPYPSLARYGWRWLKEHRYWIAFTQVGGEPAITAIMHDSADIPNRI